MKYAYENLGADQFETASLKRAHVEQEILEWSKDRQPRRHDLDFT